jgi:hypothetical protein
MNDASVLEQELSREGSFTRPVRSRDDDTNRLSSSALVHGERILFSKEQSFKAK